MNYVRRGLFVVFCILAVAASSRTQSTPEGRLMRFPDIYKDKDRFQLLAAICGWLAPAEAWPDASPAIRASRYSRNFRQTEREIAFTGQYDGNFNVETIPSEGGEPKQLTPSHRIRSTSPNAWDPTTKC